MSAIIPRQVDSSCPFLDHIIYRLDRDRFVPLPAGKKIIAVSRLNLFQVSFKGFVYGLVDHKYIVFPVNFLVRITGPPWPPARRDMSLRLGERDSFVYIDRAYTLKLNFLSIEYW